eukprot:PhF_6_TR25111/c2_g1_i1/m.34526
MSDPTWHDRLSTTTKLFRDIVLQHQSGRESAFDPFESHDLTTICHKHVANPNSKIIPPKSQCHRARLAMSPNPHAGVPRTMHCAVAFDRTTARKNQIRPCTVDKFYEIQTPFLQKPPIAFPKSQRLMGTATSHHPDSAVGVELTLPSRIKSDEERQRKSWNCRMVPFGTVTSRTPTPSSAVGKVRALKESQTPDQNASTNTNNNNNNTNSSGDQFKKSSGFSKMGFRQGGTSDKDEKAKRRRLRGCDFGVMPSRKTQMWHQIHHENLTSDIDFHLKTLGPGKKITIAESALPTRPGIRPEIVKLISRGEVLPSRFDSMIIPVGCDTRRHPYQLDHVLVTGREEETRMLYRDVKTPLHGGSTGSNNNHSTNSGLGTSPVSSHYEKSGKSH